MGQQSTEKRTQATGISKKNRGTYIVTNTQNI